MPRPHLLPRVIFTLLFLSACHNRNVHVAETEQHKSETPSVSTTANTQSFDIQYEKFTLENGLQVIFHIDRSDPVVSVVLTSHVGSARELPGKTGFAHLFEHLLFLESENLGKGGLDKMSARIGGSGANGSTSRDKTNYFQTVPNDALEKMLWAEADKLGFFINTVTDPVLAKEKQVVKNEKRQREDNQPYGHTFYVIDKNLYPDGHPYNWQVIGSLEDLQNATLQDVKDFFNRWYVPNNVTLVVSGDFNETQAKQWVHKYFDEIPRGEEVKPQNKQPAKLTQTKKLFYQDNFAQLAELTLTWPTVPQYHADSYPLEVLKELLTDGKKAPFNKVLIDELKLTANVAMFNYESELAGQLMLQVRAFENIDLDKIEAAINKSFNLFENSNISEDDLNRIKAGQETNFYQGLSSTLGKGIQLAQLNILAGDPEYINKEAKKILAVTKADVLRVYHKYIKNKPFIATSFVPKNQIQLALKNSMAAEVVEEVITVGAESSFDPSITATFSKTPSKFDRTVEPEYGPSPAINVPEVWEKQLKNRLNVFGIENSEVPLVEFNINFSGGMLFDDINKVGVANLLAELMNKGTVNKTPQQLQEAIKQLGATINFSSGRNNITLRASTLARNFEATVALVTEMLLSPRWDQTEFALLKESTLSELQQQQANPSAIANNQFYSLLYGKQHLQSKNPLGDEVSVKQISVKDLKHYYKNNLSPSLSSFHVVGDVSQQRVLTSLDFIEKHWRTNDIKLPELSRATPSKKAQIYFYDVPNAKQSELRIGYPALKATDQDFYPATVTNYLLGGGGFASQLTQQLREGKGYTYGVSSAFIANQLDGYFLISSGVRANVTLESVELINKIVTEYQENLNQQDLSITKDYFLKSNARSFETFNAKLNILYHMSQYNLPENYVQNRAQMIEGLSLERFRELAGKYIQANNMIYLVVGDANTQLDRLKGLGLGEPMLLNPKKISNL